MKFCSAKKLEKKLQLEKKQADHLMAKIMSADKPKFGKAAKAAARSPHGNNVAAEPTTEASDPSVGHRSPALAPKQNGAATPNKSSGTRCAAAQLFPAAYVSVCKFGLLVQAAL